MGMTGWGTGRCLGPPEGLVTFGLLLSHRVAYRLLVSHTGAFRDVLSGPGTGLRATALRATASATATWNGLGSRQLTTQDVRMIYVHVPGQVVFGYTGICAALDAAFKGGRSMPMLLVLVQPVWG